MYNRYIPNGASYARVVEDDGPPLAAPEPYAPPAQAPDPEAPAPAPDLPPAPEGAPPEPGRKKAGLPSLLKGLKLDDLDTGDLLLLLILLFLFLEGDDTELLITLGLLLALGLE